MIWKSAASLIFALIMIQPSRAQETPPAAAGEKSTKSADAPAKPSGAKPQKSVRKTIDQAIKALEAFDCVTVAVDFLSPIKRAQIANINAYKDQRKCSARDKGNLDEVLMALKLARTGVPEYKGALATISLEGVGLKIEKITLVKYIDGRWYFNDL